MRAVPLVLGVAIVAAGAAAAEAQAPQLSGSVERRSAQLRIYGAAVEPAEIQPGESIRVRFAVSDDAAAVPPRFQARLIGLPGNTIEAGTPTTLSRGPAPDAPSTTVIPVKAPAEAGVYPLAVAIETDDGRAAVAMIGRLVIETTRALLTDVAIVPGSVGPCREGVQIAAIRYTAEDDNGAAAVREVAVAAVPLPPRAPGRAAASDRTIVSEGPAGNFTVTSDLATAPAMAVTPPSRRSALRETVTAYTRLPCLGPGSPGWRVRVLGSILDARTQAPLPVAPVEFVVPDGRPFAEPRS